MSKKKKWYSISPSIEARDVEKIEEVTGNVYRSIKVIGNRSNQISSDLKEELISKLNEFASTTDSLEEIHENKEQIEISKYYERIPHPTLLALEEFMEGRTYYRVNPPKEPRGRKKSKESRKKK